MFSKYLKPLQSTNFKKNRKRINEENQTGIELILLFDSFILLLNLLGEFSAQRNILQNPSLVSQMIYIVLALFIYFLVLRKRETNYTAWIYFIEAPMLLITMISGILTKPDELAFTFMVFLLLFPLLILDRPRNITIFVVTMALLYGAIAHQYKDPVIFYRDMVHLINICLMTIAASIYFLSARIQNIEYAGYFAEKADEDPLTGLYNRSGAKRHIDPTKPGVFVYLDLDRFKEVNDSFGHSEGDKVLKETADILHAGFKKEDIVMRMGGDEFAVYAQGTKSKEEILHTLSRLLTSIESIHSTDKNGNTVNMTASIGCIYAPNGCASLDDMVAAADKEMYLAKENGKDKFFYAEI